MTISKHGARVAIARAAAITYDAPARRIHWQTDDEPLAPKHATAIRAPTRETFMGENVNVDQICVGAEM